jgi:hypothetical protein
MEAKHIAQFHLLLSLQCKVASVSMPSPIMHLRCKCGPLGVHCEPLSLHGKSKLNSVLPMMLLWIWQGFSVIWLLQRSGLHYLRQEDVGWKKVSSMQDGTFSERDFWLSELGSQMLAL